MLRKLSDRIAAAAAGSEASSGAQDKSVRKPKNQDDEEEEEEEQRRPALGDQQEEEEEENSHDEEEAAELKEQEEEKIKAAKAAADAKSEAKEAEASPNKKNKKSNKKTSKKPAKGAAEAETEDGDEEIVVRETTHKKNTSIVIEKGAETATSESPRDDGGRAPPRPTVAGISSGSSAQYMDPRFFNPYQQQPAGPPGSPGAYGYYFDPRFDPRFSAGGIASFGNMSEAQQMMMTMQLQQQQQQFAPSAKKKSKRITSEIYWMIFNYVGTFLCLGAFLGLGVWIGKHFGPAALVDYENSLMVTAMPTYTIVLSAETISPDGFPRSALLVNGTLPGPLLTANLGDTITVTVMNDLDVPTTIHWHGMNQKGTPYMDGPAGVNQCPIPAGESFTYVFTASPAGTFWYHAHYQGQYGDGLYGPLIVYDPNSDLEYYDERVLLLSDWYHTPIADLLVDFLSLQSGGAEPVPDSGLINGCGIFDCNNYAPSQDCNQYDNSYLWSDTWIVNQPYFLRIIGSTTFSTFFFSIDGIQLTVVEVDAIEVNPFNTTTVQVAAGQRIGVLATATKTGDYWVRATMDTSMFAYTNPNLNPDVLGILRVVANENSMADENDPHTTSTLNQTASNDMYYSTSNTSSLPSDYDVSITLEFNFTSNEYGVNLPEVNGMTYQSWDNTNYILNIANINPYYSFPSNSNVYRIPGGRVIQLIVINDDSGDHPFHLHGHAYWVMAKSYDAYNASMVSLSSAPLKRDTVRIPAGGYAILWFTADNPGTWFFHCHIEWHLAAGLAVVFLEDAAELSSSNLMIPAANSMLCSSGI